MIARVALVAVALVACTDLPEISQNVCGNGIVEGTEDCDAVDGSCVDCAWECKSDEDQPCAYAGPAFRCGVDNVCHSPAGIFDPTPTGAGVFPVLGFRITDVDFDGYGDVVGLNQTAINVRYGEASGELPDEYLVVTPQAAGNPALTQLVDIGTDDLILPAIDGLVMYTGAFGVPSPRQFPLGGGAQNMGGKPDPYDAVQIGSTIGLFGPTSDDPDETTSVGDPILGFGLITLTPGGPAYDSEAVDLCGGPRTTSRTKWLDSRISSWSDATSTSTLVAFTNDTETCVIRVSLAVAPIPRTLAPSTCPKHYEGEQPCRYQIEAIQTFPRFTAQPVFADLDGDGCPSLVSSDVGGVAASREYIGSVAGLTCAIGATASALTLSLTDEPASSALIGAVRLVPPVAGMAPDALISSFGIHAVPLARTAPWQTRRIYISDRQVQRATVGDIDHDGANDVVFSTNIPNLDIARRVPTEDVFLLVRTPTSGAVVATVIADYDGDQRDDLAYVEVLGPAQRLSIAYGTPNGLTPGVAADVFTRVDFMAHMQIADSTDPFQLVDDLIVIDIPKPRQPEITVLHGSPSRTMLSYFGPPVPLAGTAFRAVVAGDFIDTLPGALPTDPTTDQNLDLVTFQTFPDIPLVDDIAVEGTAVWVVPALSNSRLGDPQFVTMATPFSQPVFPRSTLLDDCAGNMGAQFCLQTSLLVAWPAVKSDDPLVSHDIVLGVDYREELDPMGARMVSSPHVLRYDPAGPWVEDPAAIRDDVFPAKGRIRDLIVFDVDGDGMEELVATFRSSRADATDGHVAICSMHRDGTFVGCADVAADVFHDPMTECVDGVIGRVMPACVPDGQTPHLVVSCRRLVADDESQMSHWVSSVVPILGEPGVPGAYRPAPPALERAGKLDQLQIGDITGDHVPDIVVLDTVTGTSVLQVHVALSSHEARADVCTD